MELLGIDELTVSKFRGVCVNGVSGGFNLSRVHILGLLSNRNDVALPSQKRVPMNCCYFKPKVLSKSRLASQNKVFLKTTD